MLSGIFSAVGTLLVVVLILYLAFVSTRYLGKNMKLKGNSRYMQVLDNMQLGQESSIALVKIAGEVYLIGSSASQISILSKIDENELEEYVQEKDPKVSDFKELMERMGNRKK